MAEPYRSDTKDPFKDTFKEMRIVEYSGKESEWPKWSKKFMAVAKVKKFADIIDGKIEVPKLVEDMDQQDLAIRNLNQAAYCCLLYCMNDDICFTLVETAKTEDLPDGDVALAWKNLLTRYEPKQYGTYLDLKKEFMNKTLQECENNPDTLFLELEKIRQRIACVCKEKIDDKEMIAQILNQMPNAYENKVDYIKREIDNEKDITLIEVLGHLRDKFLTLKKENKIDSTTSNNTKALIAKQFKGYCRECGEYGHKRANCPKLKNNDRYQKNGNDRYQKNDNDRSLKNDKKNDKKRFTKNVTCFYCGKKGHVERDCFKRKRDAEQGIVRPVTKRNDREENSQITTDIAYGLIASDEQQDKPNKAFALISSNIYDPNQDEMNTEKWIGDSGATVHITNNDKGMINVKECDFDITVGNEETVKC